MASDDYRWGLLMYGNLDLPQSNTAISTTEFKNGQSSIAGGGHSGIDQTYVYQVPQNSTFLYVFLVGGGSGGGRPNAAATTTGAGGGGSGSITKGILLTALLPKTLYVQIGRAGVGATTNNTAGTAGGSTGIFGYALPTGAVAVGNVILTALGGGATSAGTAGAGGAAFTTASGRWAGALANWTSQVGIVGGAGATGAGVAVTALASLPLTGGGGGSGSTTAAIGGGVTAQAGALMFPTLLGGALGGGSGFVGMSSQRPWGGTGGSGGGSIAGAGVGGNGGHAGWYGCGGGGGGNAQTTSGNGGNGGSGYALIIAF